MSLKPEAGPILAAARAARESGQLSRGWYQAISGLVIVLALVILGVVLLDRIDAS